MHAKKSCLVGFLLALLAACQVGETATTPAATMAPTAATLPTLAPTSLPTTTPKLTSTPLPLPIQAWRILFLGFPCEGRAMCVPFDDTEFSYYSIGSDGTDLEQLQISSFPPTSSLPEGSHPPADFNANPHSLGKSSLVYAGDDQQLYVVNTHSGESTLILQHEQIPSSAGDRFFVGPACWSPDGQAIRFVVLKRKGNISYPPEFYAIDLNGGNLRLLFTLPGLEDMAFGDCSPDGKEIAFSIPESPDKEKSGLYVVNLENENWRQILTSYYVSVVRTAPVESLP